MTRWTKAGQFFLSVIIRKSSLVVRFLHTLGTECQCDSCSCAEMAHFFKTFPPGNLIVSTNNTCILHDASCGKQDKEYTLNPDTFCKHETLRGTMCVIYMEKSQPGPVKKSAGG
jgi:hypothetical protein